MTAEFPSPPHGGRNHRTDVDKVTDWLAGATDVLDVQVEHEEVTFTPDVPAVQRYVPPIGWVQVDPNIGTPVFDQVEAGWSWRTVKGRKSRLAMSYDAFVAASRAQHSTWHGRQR